MQYIFQPQYLIQSHRNQNGVGTFIIPNQLQEISSAKSMNNRGSDVTKGIQPKFVH
jgi:hypothetical protein